MDNIHRKRYRDVSFIALEQSPCRLYRAVYKVCILYSASEWMPVSTTSGLLFVKFSGYNGINIFMGNFSSGRVMSMIYLLIDTVLIKLKKRKQSSNTWNGNVYTHTQAHT